MAGRERQIPSQSGHNYQGVNVYGKAQLGNSYHFEVDSPLNQLPYASEAPFNSYSRQYEPTCLDNTRIDVLRKIFDWADGQDERYIFWLNGLAGTGKSTIARTVARKYYGQKHLGASFFFSRGGRDVGNASRFVTSIAVQLANNVPPLQRYIGEGITERTDIASKSLRDQWRQLVLGPLSKLDDNSCRSFYILVVDALDECENENDIRIILSLFSEARSLDTVRLQIFITSRPEVPIRHGVYQIPEAEHQDFVLHNISPAIVDHDITIFLEHELGFIGQERALGAGWPGGEVIQRLVQHASGLFIWAATACRFIREGKRFAVRRLGTILEGSSSDIIVPEKHLDEIYLAVLKHSISTEYTDEEKNELCGMLRITLGSVVVLLSLLSASSLSTLLHLPKEHVDQTLDDLHAILDIPEDQTEPLRLHHPSFRDFLLNKSRCGDPRFWVDEEQTHRKMADGCIRLMSTALKQDICDQRRPGVLVADVESVRVEEYLSPEVQYACLYWVQHLQKCGDKLHDNDQIHEFLLVHLLHWLEALSWMRRISEGILAIISLETIALNSDCPDLYALIHDMNRFALYNRSVIEQAPLQTYYSALVFAPVTSIVRKQFKDQVPRWMQWFPDVPSGWSALLQTLEGHTGGVIAMAFSRDGQLLASASWDRTVRLWNPKTGAAMQTLKGHTSWVTAVTFSRDGLLASASDNRTVRLWDLKTGAAMQTLKGHTSEVEAIAFSRDGQLLASVSRDQTVRLWDPKTGAAMQTLKGHTNRIRAIAFSRDSQLLASASWDRTVRLWDPKTGAAIQTLKGHTGEVAAVTFSRDGLLASASDDRTVRLWDPKTGAVMQTLKGHTARVTEITFSHDGQLLASASWDGTVRLWDPKTRAAMQTLTGHTSWITAVTFSRDGLLASASWDQTVRLWDPKTGAAMQMLTGHTNGVTAMAFSRDSQLLASASASYDRTVRLWDPKTGTAIQTLEGHTGGVIAIAFSRDSQLLASASDDQTVKLWDLKTGAAIQTLKGHTDRITAVTFSRDGRLLASASDDQTVRLWDPKTGAAVQTLKVGVIVRSLSFSVDGLYLETDRGLLNITISLLSSGAFLSQLTFSRGIFVKEQWIAWGKDNLLWLPPDYRSKIVIIRGDVVILGHTSGRISFLKFALS